MCHKLVDDTFTDRVSGLMYNMMSIRDEIFVHLSKKVCYGNFVQRFMEITD